jgi:hypothetical protein
MFKVLTAQRWIQKQLNLAYEQRLAENKKGIENYPLQISSN